MTIKELEEAIHKSWIAMSCKSGLDHIVVMVSPSALYDLEKEMRQYCCIPTSESAVKDGLLGGLKLGGAWVVPFPGVERMEGYMIMERTDYEEFSRLTAAVLFEQRRSREQLEMMKYYAR